MKLILNLLLFNCLLMTISCKETAYRVNMLNIDYQVLIKAEKELGLIPKTTESLLIFPTKGCDSCSENILKFFASNNYRLADNLQIIVSGQNDELVSLSNLTFQGSIIISDHQSLMVRYGIVSTYPLFIKVSNHQVITAFEIRSEDLDGGIKKLISEMTLTNE